MHNFKITSKRYRYTVPGGKLWRIHIFFFFVSGQPASVNNVQSIRLHKPPQSEASEGYKIAEEGFTLGGFYCHPLRAIEPEIWVLRGGIRKALIAYYENGMHVLCMSEVRHNCPPRHCTKIYRIFSSSCITSLCCHPPPLPLPLHSLYHFP